MSQNGIVMRCWKQARGEREWGHMSPEEAGTQEERGIEGSLSGKENRRKKPNGEFLSSPPTLRINMRKWLWTKAGDTEVRQWAELPVKHHTYREAPIFTPLLPLLSFKPQMTFESSAFHYSA